MGSICCFSGVFTVVLQLALSGKWPDDAQAVRRVRTAFSIQIAESLRTQCGLTTQAFPNYVDVVKDGFVFRLRVAYQREPALLRQFVLPDGMIKIVDNKEAQALEREINYLPKITSSLNGYDSRVNINRYSVTFIMWIINKMFLLQVTSTTTCIWPCCMPG